jgi:hypothetical protein
MSPSLPELLTLDDLMARYGLRDRRKARWIAREAGSLKVGHRILVPIDQLVEWERRQLDVQAASTAEAPHARRSGRTRRTARARVADEVEDGYFFWDNAA